MTESWKWYIYLIWKCEFLFNKSSPPQESPIHTSLKIAKFTCKEVTTEIEIDLQV